VNLRILKIPAISVGSLLLFAGGAAVYGGTFIMPLFVQSVLGFSATSTGLLFLPGGIATILCTIISGQLLNGSKPLVKPPVLIAIGMIGFSISQWMLGNISVMSGQPDINLAMIIRGGSLGLFFTPITVATLSSLKGAEIAQGAGITNLFRQLGGSFGIAIINTYVTDLTAQHRADLIGDATPSNPEMLHRLNSISHVLQNGSYSPSDAASAAKAVFEHTVQIQATSMAYANAFVLLGVIFVIALPMLLVITGKTAQKS
jgi:DHA2 family multidrug resistance protein